MSKIPKKAPFKLTMSHSPPNFSQPPPHPQHLSGRFLKNPNLVPQPLQRPPISLLSPPSNDFQPQAIFLQNPSFEASPDFYSRSSLLSVQQHPHLYKPLVKFRTTMFQYLQFCKNTMCPYAHSQQELRKEGSPYAENDVERLLNMQNKIQERNFMCGMVCNYWGIGMCPNGDSCWNIHA